MDICLSIHKIIFHAFEVDQFQVNCAFYGFLLLNLLSNVISMLNVLENVLVKLKINSLQ